MTKKRVLITGISGFTGRYMAMEMISAGYDVYGLGSTPSDDNHFFCVDLEDEVTINSVVKEIQADIVIHLAALAFVGHEDINRFYRINVIGTRNLLEAISKTEKHPEAILVASSANIYGNCSEEVLSEKTNPNPANDYAVSKLAMEYMVRLWMDKLPLIITRPFNYTGIGQSDKFLLPKIVDHFKSKSKVIELGNLDVWRDFSDVRDVVQAYRKLIKAKAFGKIVNICSGKVNSLRNIIALCEKITEHNIEIRVNPAFIRSGEVVSLCGDVTLLHSLIGELSHRELLETLRWMLDSR